MYSFMLRQRPTSMKCGSMGMPPLAMTPKTMAEAGCLVSKTRHDTLVLSVDLGIHNELVLVDPDELFWGLVLQKWQQLQTLLGPNGLGLLSQQISALTNVTGHPQVFVDGFVNGFHRHIAVLSQHSHGCTLIDLDWPFEPGEKRSGALFVTSVDMRFATDVSRLQKSIIDAIECGLGELGHLHGVTWLVLGAGQNGDGQPSFVFHDNRWSDLVKFSGNRKQKVS